MTRVELGIAFQGNRSTAEYAALTQLVERYDFDVITVFNDMMDRPAIHPLMVAALNSRRVRLGPACLNPFTVHPVEIAGQIAALDDASGGRAYLGLARGAWLEAAGIKLVRPVRALREAAEIVRRLLAGDQTGYSGEVFSLASGTAFHYPSARKRVPLLIGTWSAQTAALAGEIADEVKIGGSANPAMISKMRQMVAVGTQRARRSDSDVGIVIGAVTVVDENGAAARERARREVSKFLDVVARFDPRGAPSTAVISDEALDRFAIAGTPEEVTGKVQALFDAGAQRVEFGSPHGLTAEDGIRLLGERVVPAVR